MPFREVASFFQPEQLDKLNAAFDAALQQLLAVNDVGTEPQIEVSEEEVSATHHCFCLHGAARRGDAYRERAARSREAA